MITIDFHTHTKFSHGKGTPEQNVLAAIQKGLKAVCISDHGPASLFFGVREKKLSELRREVDRLNQRYANDIRVYLGLECNIVADGRCDLPKDPEMFDVLLLGFHRVVFFRDAVMRKAVLSLNIPALRDKRSFTEVILKVLERYPIQILTHPGEYLPVDMALLAKGAADLGVLLELNNKHQSMSCEEISLAAAKGAMFVANSDAHSPEQVGEVTNALQAAKDAGVMDLVVNAGPLAHGEKNLRLFRTIKQRGE